MTRALFPHLPRSGVNVNASSPHVPYLRLVADAGDIMGPGTFGAYLGRVDGEWTLLQEGVLRAGVAKVGATVWQQFNGEFGNWTKFREEYKDTIWPQDTADLDWYAGRAKAWDTYLRGVAGAGTGLPALPAAGETAPSTLGSIGGTISSGLGKLGDLVPWIVVGLGLWVVLRFSPSPRERQRA
jgi:hypothetical protein